MTDGSVSSRDGLLVRLVGIEEDLRGAVAHIDAEVLSGRDAACLVDRLVHIERLAASAKALCAARVEKSGAWKADGDRSPASWLGRKSGMPATKAAEDLATGRRVAGGPAEVRQAYQSGQLSGPEASAISTATSVAPDAAGSLLRRVGSDSLNELRAECRAVQAAADDPDAREQRMRRLHANRYLRRWVDADGAGRIDARLAPDAYARLNGCLRPFEREIFNEARRQGRRERPEAYSADALIAMANEADHAEDLLTDDANAGAGKPGQASNASTGEAGQASNASTREASDASAGEASNASAGEPDQASGAEPLAGFPAPKGRTKQTKARSRRRRRSRPADAQIIYLVDYNKLANSGKPGEETCWLEGVGPIPISTVEAMKADAVLSAVVTDGVDIRSVVHLGRHATAAQHTAIIARDRCCVVPGCGIRNGLEIDHVTGWANTHETKLDDLARLCHHHHYQKTYEHWTLAGGPGHWEFNPPNKSQPAGDPAANRSPADAAPSSGNGPPTPVPARQPRNCDAPSRLF